MGDWISEELIIFGISMNTQVIQAKAKGNETAIRWAVFDSELGKLYTSYSENGLRSFGFIKEGMQVIPSSDLPDLHQLLTSQFKEYMRGERKEFDIPLDMEGTDFQKKIWALLQDIPYGKTCSYQELSELYGDSKAIRAIASANGANPVMILVPCHRVIGSDGSLTGYAGGLWRKEFLLDLERGVKRLF